VSATCTHHELDAWDHLDCRGCMALLRQTEEKIASELPYDTVPDMTGTAIEDVTGEMARVEMMFAVRRRYYSEGMRFFLVGAPVSRPLDDHRTLIPSPPPEPLLDRDPTPADLEAERDLPRPGVWAGEVGADLRALTQDETDALIRYELWWDATSGSKDDPGRTIDEVTQLVRALGCQSGAVPQNVLLGQHIAARQRGGIDSDPLVRVLARRAWRDRDRQWFELRAVRTRDAVRVLHTRYAWRLGR
jgi:hypothetical protein